MKACAVAYQLFVKKKYTYWGLRALHAIVEGPIHYYDKTSLSIEEENELKEELVRMYPEKSHWYLKVITDAEPLDTVYFHIYD